LYSRLHLCKNGYLDAQGWVYSPNIPTAIYLAEDGDMVLEYTQYNENAVMNKCLTPIAK
jgi:hypothetical protein